MPIAPAAGRMWTLLAIAAYAGAAAWLRYRPAPAGIHGKPHHGNPKPGPPTFHLPEERVRFLFDRSWRENGERREELRIADHMLRSIGRAEQAVLDVFLFDLHDVGHCRSRPLTRELAETLRRSDVDFTMIADPVNTLYGTHRNPPFEWLEEAGGTVVHVDLTRLPHNNVVYGPLYELLARVLPRRNMFETQMRKGQVVSPYALATALAARADHRKVLVTHGAEGCTALVSSGNLNDSSAFLDDVAIEVGDARFAGYLRDAELRLAEASGHTIPWRCKCAETAEETDGPIAVTPLMGEAIGDALLEDLEATRAGDTVVIATLFLSSRPCIEAILAAHERGVRMHVVLDNNQKSFGADAGGFPNRIIVQELLRRAPGMDVRWHATEGRYHGKLMLIRSGERRIVHIGSANMTRRSLVGTNLETNVRVEMPASCAPAGDVERYVADLVSDACSMPVTRDEGVAWTWRAAYRIGERIGMINC